MAAPRNWISAFFIGPHAENMQLFRQAIDDVLDELQAARQRYAPLDSIAITSEIQASEKFQKTAVRIEGMLNEAVTMLSMHSLPFWSPRYSAHMCPDLAMPAMVGYFMGMLWNPNNVTVEVSPFTSRIEFDVGKQFCEMFRYNIDPKQSPVGWGHVTSGGTVANLEAIWVARNLKFYPLSLRRAIAEGELRFVDQEFRVETCEGATKSFLSFSTWELMNMKPETVLNLPDKLIKQYKITREELNNAISPYSIQCTGKDELERHFGIQQPTQIIMGKAYHYSWVKGAALTGIGSNHVIGIELDHRARVSLTCLERHLERCLASKQAVYAVVAIIGSTEEGSCDQLHEIIEMRKRFQAKGLSFLVHADAAWGGYFATMIPVETESLNHHELNLRDETRQALAALSSADSITVDPHKSGYIPYPAGALVYRDERMRRLIAWTSPYLTDGSEESMGIYGIEGSKPGAAVLAIFVAHETIGLTYNGYGALLRQVSFNRAMISAAWATMSTVNDSFIIVPFDMIPSERICTPNPDNIEQERERIRTEILGKSLEQIVESDAGKPKHERALTLLQQLGSDLNINTFAINWKHLDRSMNRSTKEANDLMRRIVRRLSTRTLEEDPFHVPMYLTSTEFSLDRYGQCVANFKRRLQLDPSCDGLFVLRNVVMSPFAAQGTAFRSMMGGFRGMVEEEVKRSQKMYEQRQDTGL